jgi:hypothetical protein
MSDHDETFQQPPSTSVATGPLLFVLCFVLFLGGFWLMAISFSHDSGMLFGLGLLASGLSFVIPMHFLRS